MNDKEAFVNQIRATPDDDFPRLVYADFLTEQGDQRGELIRLQCSLPNLDVMAPEWRETKHRINSLLDQHAERWLSPLKQAGALGVTRRSFHRGLVERVVVDISQVGTSIDQLCELEPALQHLEVRCQSNEELRRLADVDLPTQIATLDLSHNNVPETGLQFVAEALWSQTIETIMFQNCRLTDSLFKPFLSVQLPMLRGLDLGNNALTGATFDPLTDAPIAGQLFQLDLSTNPIGNASHFERMGDTMRALRRLELALCSLGSTAVEKLLKTQGLQELQTLNLRSNGLTEETIRAFATQTAFPKLTELDVRSNLRSEGRYGYGRGSREPTDLRATLQQRYPGGFKL